MRNRVLAGLVLGMWAVPVPAASLAEQIVAAYPVTEMDGLKVTKPGTILQVKKEGLQANPSGSKLKAFSNDYEDGQVTTGAKSSAAGAALSGLTNVPGFMRKKAKIDARALAVDEKAYLLKVDVQPSAIVMLIQTCGTCDPAAVDPAHHPYLASVAVHFVNGFQTATDLKHVQNAISEILAKPEENAGGDQNAQSQPQQPQPEQQEAAPAPAQPAPAPAPAQQQYDAIAPPPAPPADPVQISVGQTIDQVTAAMGQPSKVVKAGAKQIYFYKDLKITFVNGKVTDVE